MVSIHLQEVIQIKGGSYWFLKISQFLTCKQIVTTFFFSGSPCDSFPCHNNGTCIVGNSGYTCECVKGYEGDHCQSMHTLYRVHGAHLFNFLIGWLVYDV